MPDTTTLVVVGIIAVALGFDFVNGFHDAANSIATVVSTRVLTPFQGVAWAAWWNFVAAFTFGTAVAHTVGGGLVDVKEVNTTVIFAGLFGAIAWDLFTWRVGLPTSSSHALIGGYAGAAIVKAGWNVIIVSGWVKTIAFIFIAPVLGWALGTAIMLLLLWIFHGKSPQGVDHLFRRGQLVSAGAYSLMHGTNDAQKTMGIIAGLLFTVPQFKHLVSDPAGALVIPFWIVLICHAAMGLGTLSGGWRIIHTMGNRITKLVPLGGFAAETAGAITLFMSTSLGVPVSTTHTIAGGIVGVGAVRGRRHVRWAIAQQIVWAWILTIPVSAVVAAAVYFLITRL